MATVEHVSVTTLALDQAGMTKLAKDIRGVAGKLKTPLAKEKAEASAAHLERAASLFADTERVIEVDCAGQKMLAALGAANKEEHAILKSVAPKIMFPGGHNGYHRQIVPTPEQVSTKSGTAVKKAADPYDEEVDAMVADAERYAATKPETVRAGDIVAGDYIYNKDAFHPSASWVEVTSVEPAMGGNYVSLVTPVYTQTLHAEEGVYAKKPNAGAKSAPTAKAGGPAFQIEWRQPDNSMNSEWTRHGLGENTPFDTREEAENAIESLREPDDDEKGTEFRIVEVAKKSAPVAKAGLPYRQMLRDLSEIDDLLSHVPNNSQARAAIVQLSMALGDGDEAEGTAGTESVDDFGGVDDALRDLADNQQNKYMDQMLQIWDRVWSGGAPADATSEESADEGEPDEEDVTTEDGEHFYYLGRLIASSEDELREWGEEGYTPTVWMISDHGNAHVMSFDWTPRETSARSIKSIPIGASPDPVKMALAKMRGGRRKAALSIADAKDVVRRFFRDQPEDWGVMVPTIDPDGDLTDGNYSEKARLGSVDELTAQLQEWVYEFEEMKGPSDNPDAEKGMRKRVPVRKTVDLAAVERLEDYLRHEAIPTFSRFASPMTEEVQAQLEDAAPRVMDMVEDMAVEAGWADEWSGMIHDARAALDGGDYAGAARALGDVPKRLADAGSEAYRAANPSRKGLARKGRVRKTVSPSASMLKSMFKLDDAKANELFSAMQDMEPEEALEIANAILDGHGVEGIYGPQDEGTPDDFVVSYVNMGDPYVHTIIWDETAEEFLAGGWGDLLEEYEAKAAEDGGDENDEDEDDGYDRFGNEKRAGPSKRSVRKRRARKSEPPERDSAEVFAEREASPEGQAWEDALGKLSGAIGAAGNGNGPVPPALDKLDDTLQRHAGNNMAWGKRATRELADLAATAVAALREANWIANADEIEAAFAAFEAASNAWTPVIYAARAAKNPPSVDPRGPYRPDIFGGREESARRTRKRQNPYLKGMVRKDAMDDIERWANEMLDKIMDNSMDDGRDGVGAAFSVLTGLLDYSRPESFDAHIAAAEKLASMSSLPARVRDDAKWAADKLTAEKRYASGEGREGSARRRKGLVVKTRRRKGQPDTGNRSANFLEGLKEQRRRRSKAPIPVSQGFIPPEAQR